MTIKPSLSAAAEIDAAVTALLSAVAGHRLILAVSGGCDSMVMMAAVAAASREPSVSVATFDHGTGPHARDAAALVSRQATRLGLQVRVGRATAAGRTEAEWRAARWSFLRDSSGGNALIATAHTRDDQIETVVMRALRGAGARGLAGLAAPAAEVVRPFLSLSRQAVREYAAEREVAFIEDPSNESRQHLRNRVRLDLLPAIRRVRPRFGDEMLEVAEKATQLRAELDALVMRFVSGRAQDGSVRVARHELAAYDSAALCVLWPAIAARAHVTLDRRGTLRLAQFTTSGVSGARVQLSGGHEVFRHRDWFVIHRLPQRTLSGDAVPLDGAVTFGDWQFTPVASDGLPERQIAADETVGGGWCVEGDDPWTAELPADKALSVRAWRPADRMRAQRAGTARRVKRFFGDAQIPGPSRSGWPVVLADDEIVWIPGVRRSDAAPERSGRPVVRYACERFAGDITTN